MKESWKEIKDHEGLYWVSNLGHIKNKHNHILKPDRNNNGKAVYCFDLDEYFKSITEAAIKTKVNRTSILKACRGQLHQAGGKLWCYTKDKDKKFTHR